MGPMHAGHARRICTRTDISRGDGELDLDLVESVTIPERQPLSRSAWPANCAKLHTVWSEQPATLAASVKFRPPSRTSRTVSSDLGPLRFLLETRVDSRSRTSESWRP